ncbi:hypothetical protein JTE90_024388 [Oedothorax gibbosus]|uniref:Uncharacterized protein n=1 Tax=Oedothorax gibbosus TaxID=931172 RepID=A0AAV6TS06_9ARAC|nr:hypothetical protein JTE90_024388 [Oedothorax gibbosus]
MALYYYRRTRLQNFDFGKQISLLIEDIRKVYPGPGLTGLTLKHLDDPTPSSTGIEHLMPKQRKRKSSTNKKSSKKSKPIKEVAPPVEGPMTPVEGQMLTIEEELAIINFGQDEWDSIEAFQ